MRKFYYICSLIFCVLGVASFIFGAWKMYSVKFLTASVQGQHIERVISFSLFLILIVLEILKVLMLNQLASTTNNSLNKKRLSQILWFIVNVSLLIAIFAVLFIVFGKGANRAIYIVILALNAMCIGDAVILMLHKGKLVKNKEV